MSSNNENTNNDDVLNLQNIESLSYKDLARLFNKQKLAEPMNVPLFPTMPTASNDEVNQKVLEQFFMVQYLSLARKYGFFVGINVITTNTNTLQDVQQALTGFSIPYYRFPFTYKENEKIKSEIERINQIFVGTPQQISQRIAFEWIPDIISYMSNEANGNTVLDEIGDNFISKIAMSSIIDFSNSYDGETIKDVIYTLALAIDSDVAIHDSNGRKVDSFTFEFLVDTFANPYAFIANLEQIINSEILELVDLAVPLLELYTSNTNNFDGYEGFELCASYIECLLNTFVAIEGYYIHILFNQLDASKYEELITALTGGEISLFLVDKEIRIIIETFINYLQEQVPFVPNVLVCMNDTNDSHE